ncbi:MmpS family transport accessory protein [Mycobacterium sp.]
MTYEVYGPSDTAGSVSYLDKNAQSEKATFDLIDSPIPLTIPA